MAWLDELRQSHLPLRERLIVFYTRYADEVLTRRWLRLFLYSSLAENPMAAAYEDSVVNKILEVVVEVASKDLGIKPPSTATERHRIGWILHGAIVMAGIRVHVYGISSEIAWRREISLWVDSFISGLPEICEGKALPGDSTRATDSRQQA